LGQLAGGVAHDFNNLLGVILNYAAFVRDEVAKAQRGEPGVEWSSVSADVDQIHKAARRATALTRQLLAFARREVINPDVITLNDIVAETDALLRRTLGAHIELVSSLADDLWPVLADAGQVEQVLMNLAVNARDAMPTGGTLHIETSNVKVDESYASSRPELEPGRYVRLRVSDTGMGMDPAVAERAFEPFFTTKSKGEGTGLGLATIYGIITQAGGQVRLYSEPGIGTTFTILLPATEQQARRLSDPGLPAVGGTGEVVLVVEDEDGIREVATRILSQWGYHVLTASRGDEAIEIARAHDGPIHLLVTDVIMPGMLGKEVAERLLAMRPTLRVMYMSGYAQPVLGSSNTLPSDMVLIEKPFSERELLAKVREALGAAEPAV
jgi:CheY-like chemotaxis protein